VAALGHGGERAAFDAIDQRVGVIDGAAGVVGSNEDLSRQRII
jgi:hypothetical protein